MNWSPYQEAVFARISNARNEFVNAVAGSGKTTVIEECIRRVPFEETVLAVSFTRVISDELARRFEHLVNVRACSLNSFGNSVIRASGWAKLNENKTFNLVKYDIMDGCKTKPQQKLFYSTRYAIAKVIGLLKANLMFQATKEEVARIVADFDINIHKDVSFDEFFNLLDAAYSLSWKKKVIDWDDQIVFPIYHDMEIPQYDRVFVDESQDLTKAQIELTRRAIGRKATYVGDPRQAIYQFRGADTEAVDNIIKTMDCDELPLSVCYRCSKAVIREAQKYVSHIEAHPDAPEGAAATVEERDYQSKVGDGHFVLCRCTAPLVQECLRLIREGMKATIKGRDIGEDLLELIDPELSDALTTEEIDASIGPKVEAMITKHPKNELVWRDKFETIQAFYPSCPTLGAIRKKIAEIFDDETVTGIRLMTVHRSKGLQAPVVHIIRPDLIPHPKSNDPESEENLHYVAITRAQLEIYHVDPPKR
jgi:DNA helicase-2/ATP-dependent DNA helicase PcrA